MTETASFPIQQHRGGLRLASWAAHYPEWMLACVALASWLILRDVRLSHDTFWQFWVARQMLGGEQLYIDIWEINPPLWFWSAMPVEWLANRTGIAWQHLQIGLVVFGGFVSTLLVAKFVPIADRPYRLVLSLVVFLIATVFPLGDIGQRDHLTLVFSLPYAALIARRHAGLTAPAALSVVAGLLAAYGFAMKHYFFVVPIVLEIWLLIRLRRAWSPWRPETLVLTIAATVYVIAIFVFAPGFLTVAIPTNLAAYGGVQVQLIPILQAPWVTFWVMCAAFICVAMVWQADFREREANAFHISAIILFAAFAFAYYLQHKVAFYHSVPATGAIAIAVCLSALRLHIARSPTALIGAALLALPLSFYLTPDPDDIPPFARPSIDMLKTVPAGEVAFVMAFDPRIAWPIIDERKLVWPSRASTLWMVPGIAKGELNRNLSAEMQTISTQVISSVSEDLRCNPPHLIVIPHDYVFRKDGRTFDLREYLLRDGELRSFLGSHYKLLPPPNYGYSYVRQGQVAGMRSADCRVIH